MPRRRVNYDVGRVLDGINWRPAFDPAETRRELEIIHRADLIRVLQRAAGLSARGAASRAARARSARERPGRADDAPVG